MQEVLDPRTQHWPCTLRTKRKALPNFQDLWQFGVLPFDFCSASSKLDRLAESELRGGTEGTFLVFLDVVKVFARTFQGKNGNLLNVTNVPKGPPETTWRNARHSGRRCRASDMSYHLKQ
jgi:hypothetical protein